MIYLHQTSWGKLQMTHYLDKSKNLQNWLRLMMIRNGRSSEYLIPVCTWRKLQYHVKYMRFDEDQTWYPALIFGWLTLSHARIVVNELIFKLLCSYRRRESQAWEKEKKEERGIRKCKAWSWGIQHKQRKGPSGTKIVPDQYVPGA